MTSRNIRLAVAASLAGWALALLVYSAILIIDHAMGDLSCEEPVGSSNYGHASWQWWMPGTRCSYQDADPLSDKPGLHVFAHVDRPSALSGAAAILLLLWPAGTLLGARAARLRPSAS